MLVVPRQDAQRTVTSGLGSNGRRRMLANAAKLSCDTSCRITTSSIVPMGLVPRAIWRDGAILKAQVLSRQMLLPPDHRAKANRKFGGMVVWRTSRIRGRHVLDSVFACDTGLVCRVVAAPRRRACHPHTRHSRLARGWHDNLDH